MTTWRGDRPRPRSSRVAEIGKRHVILFYGYVDRGDLDGCASLLDDGVQADLPSTPPAQGPREVLALARDRLSVLGMHLLHRTVTENDAVVVQGGFTESTTRQAKPFVDHFTFSDHGLIKSWKRSHLTRWPLSH